MITQDIAKQILPPAPVSPNVGLTGLGPTPMVAPGLGFAFPPGAGYPVLGFPVGGVLPSVHIPGINQPPPVPISHVDPLSEVLGEEQRQLLEHVMQLTPEQIDKLQPQERMQIMQLRQTMMSLNWGPR